MSSQGSNGSPSARATPKTKRRQKNNNLGKVNLWDDDFDCPPMRHHSNGHQSVSFNSPQSSRAQPSPYRVLSNSHSPATPGLSYASSLRTPLQQHTPPPFTFAQLDSLCDMFTSVEREVIRHLLQDAGGRSEVVIEFLLGQAQQEQEVAEELAVMKLSAAEEAKVARRRPNLFSLLPSDALSHICAHLSMYEQCASFATLNRECGVIARQAGSQVTHLNFAKMRLKDWPDWRMLRMIARFPSVQALNLSRCMDFDSWELLPSSCHGALIGELNLSQTTLTDHGLQHVMSYMGSQLNSILLTHTLVTDEGLEYISVHGRQIQRVVLNQCTKISGRGVAHMIDQCHDIQMLSLQGTEITAETLKPNRRRSGFNTLEELNISRCRRLSRLVLSYSSSVSPGHYRNLRVLDVSVSPQLREVELDLCALTTLNLSSSTILVRASLKLPNLTDLNLSGCTNLTDLTLIGSTKLRKVNLYGCRSLVLGSLHDLFHSGRHTLYEANLTGLIQLVDQALEALVRLCRGWCLMTIQGCRHVREEVVARMEKVMTQRVWMGELMQREARMKRQQEEKDFARHRSDLDLAAGAPTMTSLDLDLISPSFANDLNGRAREAHFRAQLAQVQEQLKDVTEQLIAMGFDSRVGAGVEQGDDAAARDRDEFKF